MTPRGGSRPIRPLVKIAIPIGDWGSVAALLRVICALAAEPDRGRHDSREAKKSARRPEATQTCDGRARERRAHRKGARRTAANWVGCHRSKLRPDFRRSATSHPRERRVVANQVRALHRVTCLSSLAIVRSSGAKGAFNYCVRSLRARYDYDTVKGDGEKPGPLHMRSEEGEGLSSCPSRSRASESTTGFDRSMARSMPVGRQRPPSARERREIGARALVALEVVWSPSVDQDRLSSAELVVLYPELVRLRPNQLWGERAVRTVTASSQQSSEGARCAARNSPPRCRPSAPAKPSSQRVRPCSHCNWPRTKFSAARAGRGRDGE